MGDGVGKHWGGGTCLLFLNERGNEAALVLRPVGHWMDHHFIGEEVNCRLGETKATRALSITDPHGASHISQKINK